MTEPQRSRPSALLPIATVALAGVGLLLLWARLPEELLFFLLLVGAALGLALLYQGQLTAVVRRHPGRSLVRAPRQGVPAILLLLGLLIPSSSCSRPDQEQRLASPDGRHELRLSVHDHRWIVAIHAASGEREYRDEQSELLARFNVYRGWDDESRLWLYNSDDGQVYYWERGAQGWKKQVWDRARSTLKPPAHALPDYAKKAGAGP